ncbi:MAG: hypothetical protein AAGA87_09960 [Pseudomonadota bacterium]
MPDDEKKLPVKDLEKDWSKICGDVEKLLKAQKMDPKVSKQVRQCIERASKNAIQEAAKTADRKTKSIDPKALEPILKKPPKEFFLPIKLEGKTSKPGDKNDTIKIKVGGKNLFLEGAIKIDDKKGTVQFDKGLMLMFKGRF